MNKLKQAGFTLTELIGGIIAFAAIVGWIMNIVTIAHTTFTPFTGELALRLAGIFVFPLGSVMGYL